DAGLLGTVCDEFADLASLRGLVTVEAAKLRLHRRCGSDRVALAVIDDLDEHVARRARHDEARTHLGADDLLAKPGVPAALGGRLGRAPGSESHDYLPLFPAVRRTTSPA